MVGQRQDRARHSMLPGGQGITTRDRDGTAPGFPGSEAGYLLHCLVQHSHRSNHGGHLSLSRTVAVSGPTVDSLPACLHCRRSARLTYCTASILISRLARASFFFFCSFSLPRCETKRLPPLLPNNQDPPRSLPPASPALFRPVGRPPRPPQAPLILSVTRFPSPDPELRPALA